MNSGCFTSEFAKHMTNKYCLCLSTYVSAFGFVGFILFYFFWYSGIKGYQWISWDNFERLRIQLLFYPAGTSSKFWAMPTAQRWSPFNAGVAWVHRTIHHLCFFNGVPVSNVCLVWLCCFKLFVWFNLVWLIWLPLIFVGCYEDWEYATHWCH